MIFHGKTGLPVAVKHLATRLVPMDYLSDPTRTKGYGSGLGSDKPAGMYVTADPLVTIPVKSLYHNDLNIIIIVDKSHNSCHGCLLLFEMTSWTLHSGDIRILLHVQIGW